MLSYYKGLKILLYHLNHLQKRKVIRTDWLSSYDIYKKKMAEMRNVKTIYVFTIKYNKTV